MVGMEESIGGNMNSGEQERNQEQREFEHVKQEANHEEDPNESKNKNPSEILQTVKILQAEILSMKADNERIMKSQEEINRALLSKMQEQENNKNKEKEHNYDAETTSCKRKNMQHESSDNKEHCSSDGSEERKKNKKNYSSDSSDNGSPHTSKHKLYEELAGEFRKIRPPTFNGEVEKGEEVEAWLSGMKKYFQIYNYSNKLKAIMAIYNLTGKVDIWWQDVKRVKILKEKYVTWTVFKKYFKRKYLSDQYFE